MNRRKRKHMDRDPRPPANETVSAADGRVLDPTGSLGVEGVVVRTTSYVSTRLTISKWTAIPDDEPRAAPSVGSEHSARVTGRMDTDQRDRVDARFALVSGVADDLGWLATLEPEDPKTVSLRYGVLKVGLDIKTDADVVLPPDAFTLLQQLRLRYHGPAQDPPGHQPRPRDPLLAVRQLAPVRQLASVRLQPSLRQLAPVRLQSPVRWRWRTDRQLRRPGARGPSASRLRRPASPSL